MISITMISRYAGTRILSTHGIPIQVPVILSVI